MMEHTLPHSTDGIQLVANSVTRVDFLSLTIVPHVFENVLMKLTFLQFLKLFRVSKIWYNTLQPYISEYKIKLKTIQNSSLNTSDLYETVKKWLGKYGRFVS